MALNINQFAMSVVQGQIDLPALSNVISAQVDAAQGTALVAGQAVKLATTSGGVPKVLALASNSETPFGYVIRNLKDASFAAGAAVEIALAGAFMYMTAGAAITRGSAVENVIATTKVITNAGVNPTAGIAIDTAAADGDLIRVQIANSANAALGTVKSVNVTATLAEINAGKTLIPAVAGKAITVVGMTRRVTGTAAAATSADVQSSNGTPVKVMVDAIAGLTNGAVIINNGTNSTPGAGWGVPLGSGDGLVVANVGSAMITLTSIQYTIQYIQK